MLGKGCQTRPPRKSICISSVSCIRRGQSAHWSNCVVLLPEPLFRVAHSSPASGILAASGSELWEQPPAEVTDSIRGWPASNDWRCRDTKAHPHWHSWGQLRRVIPGPEPLMELNKASVFASPYASSHHPFFLTDVSPNYSLQLTFWLQFSVSESDSREPHQRKFNMWLIPHI